jgi:hypothetical protein
MHRVLSLCLEIGVLLLVPRASPAEYAADVAGGGDVCPAVVVGDLESFLGGGCGALFAGCMWHGFGGGVFIYVYRYTDGRRSRWVGKLGFVDGGVDFFF